MRQRNTAHGVGGNLQPEHDRYQRRHASGLRVLLLTLLALALPLCVASTATNTRTRLRAIFQTCCTS